MQTLCRLDEIEEGHARGFSLDQLAIIAIKKQGKVYLYHNSCPHRGINLEWQPDQFLDADRELIQCATHGALFLIENGQCVQGPCLGDHLKPIEYTIQDQQIMVDLAAYSDQPQASPLA